MMDVDTVSHDSEEKLPSSKPAGAGSKPECGFIVPEPHPHFSDMDSHVVFANNSFFRLLQVSLLPHVGGKQKKIFFVAYCIIVSLSA